MELSTNEAILRPYAYGTGIEKIYQRIERIDTFREPVTIICPNRMIIKGLEKYWLENAGGMIGLHLLTFDDFVREMTGSLEPVPTPILTYVLYEQIQLLKNQSVFKSLGTSASFESLSEELVELFRELNAQGIRLSGNESGLFGDLGKIFERYEKFLCDNGLYDLGMVYQSAIELLMSEEWPAQQLMIFGFESFRPYEWEIISFLVNHGRSIEIYHPMSELKSKTMSHRTLEKLETLPIQRKMFENSSQKYNARFIYGNQDIDVYKHLLYCIAEDGDLSKTAIYATTEQVRSEIAMVGENLNIPIENPIQSLRVDDSLLARDFKDYFLCLEQGKSGIINFLRSHYFKQADNANLLINVLESFDFEDIYDLNEKLNRVQKIRLSAEEHQLLFDHLNYFLALDQSRKNLSFQDLINESRAVLEAIEDEYLLQEDLFMHSAMLEVLDELTIYCSYLHSISREGFIKLFYEFLERREDRTFQMEGLNLINLEQGIDQKYEKIYLVDASINWPSKKGKSFLDNPSIKNRLCALGYLPPEDDFNYLKGKAQLESLLTAGEEIIFAWIGSDEEYSLMLEEFFEMTNAEKFQIQGYPMEKLSSDSTEIQSQRLRLLASRVQKSSPYHGALKFEMGGELGRQIKSSALNATLLDRFARCPFAAYVEKFLLPEYKMQDPKSMIHLETGNIYHQVLEETRGEVADLASVSNILNRHYRQSLLCQGKSEAEQQIETDYMLTRLMRFIEEDQARIQDKKRDLGFKGHVFEERFEGEIRGLKWRGSIDRIDRNNDGNEILIDYKKGSIPSIGDVLEGRVWQLIIYAHIRRLQGHPVAGITYGSIEGSEFRSYLRNKDRIGQYGRLNRKTDLSESDFEVFFEDSLMRLDKILNKLNKMEFHPDPIQDSHCTSCLYRMICRKEEAPWLS